MSRGVRTPTELRNLLNVGYKTAEGWMQTVRDNWSKSLSDERVNWRREKLYQEADEVARVAWLDAMVAETSSERNMCLKIVIEANKRKASLCGLDKLELKLDARVETHQTIDVVASVEADFGLAPGALESIGREAAILLSKPAENVIEAEADEILQIEAVAGAE